MCCAFLILVMLGPRVAGALWWLFEPARWGLTFNNWWGGGLWWIWPALGILVVPWATLMYVIVAPGGITGFDWIWIAIGLVADFMSYGGGAGRKQIPGYQGY